jgi:membrane dipeptidase
VAGDDQELAEEFHATSIVVDLVSPLATQAFSRAVEDYRAGGVSALGATVGLSAPSDLAPEALRSAALLRRLIRDNDDKLHLIEKVSDFEAANASGRLGIFFHFQNSMPFERNLDLVEAFYALGVRMAQLAYNVRSFAADGCTQFPDGGLSQFGRRLVTEMNQVGMIVDGAHCGYRSSLEAIAASEAPFVFSHVSCKALIDHPRAITDDQIRACADTGGLVGIVGLPYFLGPPPYVSLEPLVRHIVHAVEVAGIDHVGIGLDFYAGLKPYTTVSYDEPRPDTDVWHPGDLPSPTEPAEMPEELATPARMRNLTAALVRAGLDRPELEKIWAANFIRVSRAVWKP